MAGRAVVMLTIALGAAALAVSQLNVARGLLNAQSHLHVWYHLGFFAALGLLAIFSSSRPSVRIGLLLFAVLIGVAIEYGEVLRYHTDMEWYDVRTDATGIAIGAIFAWLALHIPDRRY